MLDPRTSALLVVDLQNDTVGEQGAFADAGAAEFASRHRVVEKVRGLDTDDHFSHQFTVAGSYAYYCTIHAKMTATIIVR